MKPLFAVLAFGALAAGLRLRGNGEADASVVSQSEQQDLAKSSHDDDDDLHLGWLYDEDPAPGKVAAPEDNAPSETSTGPGSDEDDREDTHDHKENNKHAGGENDTLEKLPVDHQPNNNDDDDFELGSLLDEDKDPAPGKVAAPEDPAPRGKVAAPEDPAPRGKVAAPEDPAPRGKVAAPEDPALGQVAAPEDPAPGKVAAPEDNAPTKRSPGPGFDKDDREDKKPHKEDDKHAGGEQDRHAKSPVDHKPNNSLIGDFIMRSVIQPSNFTKQPTTQPPSATFAKKRGFFDTAKEKASKIKNSMKENLRSTKRAVLDTVKNFRRF